MIPEWANTREIKINLYSKKEFFKRILVKVGNLYKKKKHVFTNKPEPFIVITIQIRLSRSCAHVYGIDREPATVSTGLVVEPKRNNHNVMRVFQVHRGRFKNVCKPISISRYRDRWRFNEVVIITRQRSVDDGALQMTTAIPRTIVRKNRFHMSVPTTRYTNSFL